MLLSTSVVRVLYALEVGLGALNAVALNDTNNNLFKGTRSSQRALMFP